MAQSRCTIFIEWMDEWINSEQSSYTATETKPHIEQSLQRTTNGRAGIYWINPILWSTLKLHLSGYSHICRTKYCCVSLSSSISQYDTRNAETGNVNTCPQYKSADMRIKCPKEVDGVLTLIILGSLFPGLMHVPSCASLDLWTLNQHVVVFHNREKGGFVFD